MLVKNSLADCHDTPTATAQSSAPAADVSNLHALLQTVHEARQLLQPLLQLHCTLQQQTYQNRQDRQTVTIAECAETAMSRTSLGLACKQGCDHKLHRTLQ